MTSKAFVLLISLLLCFLQNFHDLEIQIAYFDEMNGEKIGPLLLPTESMIRENFDHVGSSKVSDSIVVSVDDYGAAGGGADDTMAFEKAWKYVCSSIVPASLVVPNSKAYLLKPITFFGPCKSNVSVTIKGTIEASSNISDWSNKNKRIWILFTHLENLIVGGGGTINGNGWVWWEKSCKIDKSQPCRDAPTALTFRSCNYLTVKNLNMKDSQQIHLKFEKCNSVIASTISIDAPEKSPNTDGIHISETTNVQIAYCNIRTGDDCISIVSGSHGVKANHIFCGPGHGISIGSLGAKNSEAQVSDITVDTAQLSGTTNGVRIKTWQGGKGYAKNVLFKNINMDNVKNPIIIDQNYCDRKNCRPQKSSVQISNVQYQNIKGTSASKLAINFNCSKTSPCKGIILQDINLMHSYVDAQSFCQNVYWRKLGTVIPPPCNLNYFEDYVLSYFNHLVSFVI